MAPDGQPCIQLIVVLCDGLALVDPKVYVADSLCLLRCRLGYVWEGKDCDHEHDAICLLK